VSFQDTASGHVLGVDAGGTSTRALAVAADGTTLGSGRAGGANPNSHPPGQAAAQVAEAIAGALDGLDPAATRGCVIGMAGRAKLTDPAVAAVFERAWRGAGLDCPVRVVSDAEAAFASATGTADGTVLVAGTGSIAGRIRGRRMVSTAGGYGWLLGDEGSAFWVGRAAARVALDELTGGRQPGALATAVLAAMLGGQPAGPAGAHVEADERLRTAHRLISAVNAEEPIALAGLAPLVSEAHAAGDPAAERITEEAGQLLAETALRARDAGEATPVVLVGGMLSDSPVGGAARRRLAEAGLRVLSAADGALGAAWLAALDAHGEQAPRPSP
jgi:N-acetylglucosamine kinase-like BadF-type ATPase